MICVLLRASVTCVLLRASQETVVGSAAACAPQPRSLAFGRRYFPGLGRGQVSLCVQHVSAASLPPAVGGAGACRTARRTAAARDSSQWPRPRRLRSPAGGMLAVPAALGSVELCVCTMQVHVDLCRGEWSPVAVSVSQSRRVSLGGLSGSVAAQQPRSSRLSMSAEQPQQQQHMHVPRSSAGFDGHQA